MKAEDYNSLLLPKAVMNPDNLRTVSFVNNVMESGKPVAAICHSPGH